MLLLTCILAAAIELQNGYSVAEIRDISQAILDTVVAPDPYGIGAGGVPSAGRTILVDSQSLFRAFGRDPIREGLGAEQLSGKHAPKESPDDVFFDCRIHERSPCRRLGNAIHVMISKASEIPGGTTRLRVRVALTYALGEIRPEGNFRAGHDFDAVLERVAGRWLVVRTENYRAG